ncbi:MAG: LysM peptidoglycan-binding domain-containing protein [Atopobiaceae bacterium]
MIDGNSALFDGNAALAIDEAPVFVLHEGTATREKRTMPERGSKVVAALAAVAIAAAFFGAWYAGDALKAAQLRQAEASMETETYTVQDQDTLWSIASAHGAEGMSTDQMVSWLKQENGLDTSLLQPGQTLTVSAAQA